MVRRLTHHRALVAAVLATVLIAAAFTGSGAARMLAPQGIHAPRVAEQLAVHKLGDMHSAATQRLFSFGGTTGVLVGANVGGDPTAAAHVSPRTPGDWRKVTSGLVPLPLRI